MSQKPFVSVLCVALVLGVALVGPEACSSSSNSGGASGVELCNRTCDKFAMCFADAGFDGDPAACKRECTMRSGGTGGTMCSNAAAIEAKYRECLGLADCTGFLSCIESIPPCEGGAGTTNGPGVTGTSTATSSSSTGSGGSSGTGGSTGAGGGGSGASCAPCTKADACCVATGITGCAFANTCNEFSGNQRDSIIQGCQDLLDEAAADTDAPAACK